MQRLGVVTGTRVEAACLAGAAGDRPIVVCSGLDPARARGAAERLLAEGCTALASVGTAAGLDGGLKSGALVIPDSVAAPGGVRFAVDAAWRSALATRLGAAGLAVRAGTLAGSDSALRGASDKRRLHEATGAVACDMESHAVAAAAAHAGVPFLVVRAIADGVADTLPVAALAAIGPDGETRIGALLAALAVNPAELPAFIRLALASRAALRSLRRVAALGGPLLALP